MTKVLKLLGGGILAAVLGIVLFAAYTSLFNSSGINNAAPTFDRASAHVSLGAADLAPAKSVAAPIRYLPGDINATNVVRAAGSSNPLIALPANLSRAAESLKADTHTPTYDPNAPAIAVSSLQKTDASVSKTAMGINRDFSILNMLASYMKINTINVSRESASDLVNNVDFLNDSTGHPNSYTLNSRWSLITSAGASGNSFSFVKGTDISGKIPYATNNAIVTAIYGRDDTSKQYTQILPPGVNVLGATTKMTLSTGQAYWIKTTIDPSAKGIHLGNLSWADTVDRYTAAVQHARGDSVQISEPFIPAVAAGGGLVLNNDNLYTNALDSAACAGICDSPVGDIAAATRTGAGINALGSQVGIGTMTAPTDYPMVTTRWINEIATWKNYQLNAVNLTNTDGQAWIKVSNNDSDLGMGSTALDKKWYQTNVGATLTDPAALGIVAVVAILAAIAIAAWTTGPGTPSQHRVTRALGAG